MCKCCPAFYTEAQLNGMFKRFDTDRDGRLSKQELKAAFNELGSRFPGWRADRALHHADVDGDGYISIEQELKDATKYAFKCRYKIK